MSASFLWALGLSPDPWSWFRYHCYPVLMILRCLLSASHEIYFGITVQLKIKLGIWSEHICIKLLMWKFTDCQTHLAVLGGGNRHIINGLQHFFKTYFLFPEVVFNIDLTHCKYSSAIKRFLITRQIWHLPEMFGDESCNGWVDIK